MQLFPAIDLRGGRCVRLHKGDYAQETVYGDDPVAQARSFADAGAPWIHVVDLDAARTGEPLNRPVIASICADMRFMPTGGITVGDLGDYLAIPSVVACGGTWLATSTAIAGGDFAGITQRTSIATNIARRARQNR